MGMRRSSAHNPEGHGQKGGTGPTKGRTSRKLSAVIDGVVYTKRVFFNQQYLLVTMTRDGVLVTAWNTEEDAKMHQAYATKDGSVSNYALAQTI